MEEKLAASEVFKAVWKNCTHDPDFLALKAAWQKEKKAWEKAGKAEEKPSWALSGGKVQKELVRENFERGRGSNGVEGKHSGHDHDQYDDSGEKTEPDRNGSKVKVEKSDEMD